jgi:hypothetical protein
MRCADYAQLLKTLCLEAEFVALQEGRERPLADTQKRELLAFARDLPSLWDDPQSLPEHKKRLLRIALKEIIATCEGETIRLVLHWQRGDHTQVGFQKIGTGRHRYVTDDDLVEIVRVLARIEPDARIASILNRNQRELSVNVRRYDRESRTGGCVGYSAPAFR